MTRTKVPALGLALAAALGVWPCHGQSNQAHDAAEKPSTPPLVAQTPEASTAEIGRCVADHESARLSRVREQWLAARDAMTRCSQESCPLAIRSDCRAWQDELSRLLPTVLIVVERDDDRTEPVELELDGKPLKLPEPLGPIELLPGSHRLRASLVGHPPIEREIVLEIGVKNQVVRVRFSSEPKAAAELPAKPARLAPAAPRASRPIPSASYWFGGGALLALGTSGALLGSALVSLGSARDTCAPGCKSSVRDSIDARLLAADVFGGLGAALAGFSIYTFLARPSVPDSQARLEPRLGWSQSGAELALAGQF